MEKIIFLGLAIPILGFVFYLGGTAIMNGFKEEDAIIFKIGEIAPLNSIITD